MNLNDVKLKYTNDINERLSDPIGYYTNKTNDIFIKAMKSQEKNVKGYKLTLLPEEGAGNFFGVLDAQSMEVTALTKKYVVNNMAMTTISGREIIAKRALDGVMLLDYSALARGDANDKGNAEAILNTDRLFLGRLSGRGRTIVIAEYKSYLKNGNLDSIQYVCINGRQKNGKSHLIPEKKLFDENGKVKDNWTVFDLSKISSSSQGRQQQITLFANNEKFKKILSDATYGESDLTFMSEIMDAIGKEVADKTTRLSSKSCKQGCTEAKVGNVLISIEKDKKIDGAGLVSARWVEKALKISLKKQGKNLLKFKNLKKLVEGLLIQCRPLTAKGAALVVAEIFMQIKAAMLDIYIIDVSKMTEEQEEVYRFKLDKVWAAHQPKEVEERVEAALSGFNAIGIVTDPSRKDWDIYGDLNFFKDAWDLRRTSESGLNVLNIAHYSGDYEEFLGAKTNGQLLKCVMAAIQQKEGTAKFKFAANAVLKNIIDENIDTTVNFLAHPGSFDGTEPLDAGYEPNVYQLLNPVSYMGNTPILKSLLRARIDAVNTMINKDSYSVPGHNGMLTIDVAYWLLGKSLLKDYVDEQGRYVMEAYSPVADKYFNKHKIKKEDRLGIGVKNPSMGEREIVLVKYVSLSELKKRAAKVKYGNLIIKAYESFKDGGVMLSDSLTAIAWIAAGLDLDGDKIIFFFCKSNHRDLVSLVFGSGMKPRAVEIKAPGSQGGDKAALDMAMFATYAMWNMSMGNASVGVVTNTYAIFTALKYWIQGGDKAALDMATKMFKKLGAGGNKEYKSVVKVKMVDGLEVFKTSETILEDFFESIEGVKLTKKNILAMLEDLDVLGRHDQELTIDAQKKFYIVFSEWIEKITHFSVQKNKFGIKFTSSMKNGVCDISIIENLAYKYDAENKKIIHNGNVVCKETINGTYYYIADSFAEARVYAANRALQRLRELGDMLTAATQADLSKKTVTEAKVLSALRKLSNDSRLLLEQTEQKIITINTKWAIENKRLAKRFEATSKKLNDSLKEKLRQDLSAGFRDTYLDIIAALDNEVRMILSADGLNAREMVYVVDDIMKSNKVKGKLLRPERFIAMAEESDTPNFKHKLHGYAAFIVGWYNTISVSSGVAEVNSNKDIEVPLMDGDYTVELDGDDVYLVRPYAEFVEVPAIDRDMFVFKGSYQTAEELKKADELLKPGVDIFFKADARNGKAYLGTAEEPEALPIRLGSRSKSSMESTASPFTLSKNLVGDFTCGQVVQKVVCDEPSVDKYGNTYYNFTVVLHK